MPIVNEYHIYEKTVLGALFGGLPASIGKTEFLCATHIIFGVPYESF